MDKSIEKKGSWITSKLAFASMLAIIAVSAFLYFKSTNGFGAKQEDIGRLIIKTVDSGLFEEFIALRGTVASKSNVFIDAVIGGRVEEILVENGEDTEQGQLLLRLSNDTMYVNLLANEARVSEQITNMHSQKLSLRRNHITHQRELVELDYNIKKSKRIIERFSRLVENNVEARSSVEDEQILLDYYINLREIVVESQKSDLQLQESQLEQLKVSAEQLQEGLEFTKRNLENLDIVSPISGKLTGFDLMPGQNLKEGERIGIVEGPGRYKIVSFVDEFYLRRVFVGQRATAIIDGQEYILTLSKSYPNVENGQAQLDLAFEGEMPSTLRSGQSVQLKLFLSDTTVSIRLPNGGFLEDTGGGWIFVVGKDKQEAQRRNIQVGRRNSQFIEVLDGLEVGEHVIVSPYTNFKSRQKITINRSD